MHAVLRVVIEIFSEVDFTVFGLVVDIINELGGCQVIYGNSKGDFIVKIRVFEVQIVGWQDLLLESKESQEVPSLSEILELEILFEIKAKSRIVPVGTAKDGFSVLKFSHTVLIFLFLEIYLINCL